MEFFNEKLCGIFGNSWNSLWNFRTFVGFFVGNGVGDLGMRGIVCGKQRKIWKCVDYFVDVKIRGIFKLNFKIHSHLYFVGVNFVGEIPNGIALLRTAKSRDIMEERYSDPP